MTDRETVERVAEQTGEMADTFVGHWTRAHRLNIADALLDAMREVARKEITAYDKTEAARMDRDHAALVRRVAALDLVLRRLLSENAHILVGGVAFSEQSLDELDRAQDHGGTEAAHLDRREAPTPAGAASVQPAPAPEPSEEAAWVPWIVDVRVGMVAVYRSPKLNCLADRDFIFVRHGKKNPDNSWTLDPSDVETARAVCNALNRAAIDCASPIRRGRAPVGARERVRAAVRDIVMHADEPTQDHDGSIRWWCAFCGWLDSINEHEATCPIAQLRAVLALLDREE